MRALFAFCILNLALTAAPSAQSTGAFDTSELVNAARQLNANDLPRLAMEDFPHIRVTFNVTPGSAQNRVTLLVGP